MTLVKNLEVSPQHKEWRNNMDRNYLHLHFLTLAVSFNGIALRYSASSVWCVWCGYDCKSSLAGRFTITKLLTRTLSLEYSWCSGWCNLWMPCPSYINSLWSSVLEELAQIRSKGFVWLIRATCYLYLYLFLLFKIHAMHVCQLLTSIFLVELDELPVAMSPGTVYYTVTLSGTVHSADLDLHHVYLPCFAPKPFVYDSKMVGGRCSRVAAWTFEFEFIITVPGPRLLYVCVGRELWLH